MTTQRNPEATCGGSLPCPAWARNIGTLDIHRGIDLLELKKIRAYGQCRGMPTPVSECHEAHYCMQHPSFFLPDAVEDSDSD